MNYYEYIKSPQWFSFRKETLTRRKRCQHCGTTKNLNLHHRNYACLGKEKQEDIIVLCKGCHFMFHKKKKWTKVMKNNGDMAFTFATNLNREIYSVSPIKRPCNRCGKEHPVFYKIFSNGKKHLGMACPESKPRINYIKYEDIDVPVIENNYPPNLKRMLHKGEITKEEYDAKTKFSRINTK